MTEWNLIDCGGNLRYTGVPFLDLMLEVARGSIDGMGGVNKFGRATNVDSGVATDIYDRANPIDDQAIWLAPTTARIHQIVAADANDTVEGTGLRTMRIYGLTSWTATEEISEEISMNGLTNVPTVNSYVIIHRMKKLTSGASGPNISKITATADVDGTVTAQINAGVGQTHMAVFGITSQQEAYMNKLLGDINKSGGVSAAADMDLLFNSDPINQPTIFTSKHPFGIRTDGTSISPIIFSPPKKFSGPGILKLQGNGSANNLSISGSFDLVVVRK